MNNNNKKYISIIYILTILSFVIFVCINSTNAYADPSDDAPVSVDTTNGTIAQGSTRNAPVSISVYADIITESADTYVNNNTDTGVVTTQPTVVPSSLPVETPQTTDMPQGTGSPDATEEPDMISYPPTVAPAYTD